jgi:hypothetical protein
MSRGRETRCESRRGRSAKPGRGRRVCSRRQGAVGVSEICELLERLRCCYSLTRRFCGQSSPELGNTHWMATRLSCGLVYVGGIAEDGRELLRGACFHFGLDLEFESDCCCLVFPKSVLHGLSGSDRRRHGSLLGEKSKMMRFNRD